MKNKLYYLGLFSSLLVLVGCMFKIQHWPGAGIMLTLGMLFFALAFLPFAIASSFKSDEGKNNKGLYVVAFITIAYDFVSTLFTIQHWPGAGFLLPLGILLPFVLFLPVYLIYNRNDKEINYRNFAGIMFLFAYLAAISALLSLNVSKNIIDETVVAARVYEQKQEQCMAQSNYLMNKINQWPDSVAIPQRKALRQVREASVHLQSTLDRLKLEVAVRSDHDNERLASTNGKIDLWKINGKDKGIVGLETSELKAELDTYRKLILAAVNERNTREYLEKLLDTENDNNGMPWEKIAFGGKNLVAVVQMLDLLKYKVSVAEYETISQVVN